MRYQRAELPLKLDGLSAAREFFAGCLAQGDPTLGRACDEESRCLHVSRHNGDETGAHFPAQDDHR